MQIIKSFNIIQRLHKEWILIDWTGNRQISKVKHMSVGISVIWKKPKAQDGRGCWRVRGDSCFKYNSGSLWEPLDVSLDHSSSKHHLLSWQLEASYTMHTHFNIPDQTVAILFFPMVHDPKTSAVVWCCVLNY